MQDTSEQVFIFVLLQYSVDKKTEVVEEREVLPDCINQKR